MPLGNTVELGTRTDGKGSLLIDPKQRGTHLYTCGGTGAGKSRFLEGMIRQDIESWHKSHSGTMLIDPHGSVYDSLMTWLAYKRPQGVPIIPINMRQSDWIVGYNLLKQRENAERSVIVDGFVSAMLHVWGAQDATSTPRLEKWASHVMRTLLDNELTLVDAELLIDASRKTFRQSLMPRVTDVTTASDWNSLDSGRPERFDEILGSTANRLGPFLRNNLLRMIFGQAGASLDLERALSEGWIILVNLSTQGGNISETDARLFGTLLLSDLWRAAKHRGKNAKGGMKPFYLYVDEFQKFVTPTIAENLDQARGFGLHLTLANQFPRQFLAHGDAGRMLYDSVMENARSKVVFKLENPDNLDPLARWLFTTSLDPDERKLELYSTKVLDYREEQKITTSYSETDSESDGLRLPEDDEGFPIDPNLEDIKARTLSRGRSSSESFSTSLVPVLGQELSSVQFRSIDEQMHRSLASLMRQPDRHAFIRLAGMTTPVQIITKDVKDFFVLPKRVTEYEQLLLKKWDFAKPADEAQMQLDTHRAALLAEAPRLILSEEPVTARRRVVKA